MSRWHHMHRYLHPRVLTKLKTIANKIKTATVAGWNHSLEPEVIVQSRQLPHWERVTTFETILKMVKGCISVIIYVAISEIGKKFLLKMIKCLSFSDFIFVVSYNCEFLDSVELRTYFFKYRGRGCWLALVRVFFFSSHCRRAFGAGEMAFSQGRQPQLPSPFPGCHHVCPDWPPLWLWRENASISLCLWREITLPFPVDVSSLFLPISLPSLCLSFPLSFRSSRLQI